MEDTHMTADLIACSANAAFAAIGQVASNPGHNEVIAGAPVDIILSCIMLEDTLALEMADEESGELE